jgi:hypothetical protein
MGLSKRKRADDYKGEEWYSKGDPWVVVEEKKVGVEKRKQP